MTDNKDISNWRARLPAGFEDADDLGDFIESLLVEARKEGIESAIEAVKNEPRWHWGDPLTHMVDWINKLRSEFLDQRK